jgi:hypothetical protein
VKKEKEELEGKNGIKAIDATMFKLTAEDVKTFEREYQEFKAKRGNP